MASVPRTASRIVVYALAGAVWMRAADLPTFEKTVAPVLTSTCKGCHNESLASGSLDIAPFTKAGSLTENREGWEVILRKVRARCLLREFPDPPLLIALFNSSNPSSKRPIRTPSRTLAA